VRGILEHLQTTEQMTIVTDMEAGLEHLKRGTLEHAGTLLIVVEPYFKSLEACGRIAELGRNLGVPEVFAVANKVQSDRDEAAIRAYCAAQQLALIGFVPFDDDVAEAEREGIAVLDYAPSAAAVSAIRELAERLDAGSARSFERPAAD
jgi:CO dehydrogenase maturation factor